MANELGHMSAEIGLNIQPFLTNQAVLRTQIRRTGQLLRTMQSASKLAGGAGQGNIFRTQIAQLRMYGQQVENFSRQMARARQDLANHNTVDNQRGLAASATQLQNASLKYDTLRLSAARAYQQMRAQNSWWGQQAARIGDYGDRLQQVAGKIRGFGSGLASAAIGGAFFNATKAAITFKSQIQAIGPLLSNDGRITATVSAQLRTMSADSLKWSQQYGISTRSINSAMTELVRRGFTATQTLGSMPAILNASRASGESLGTVMQATASAIEMFGLKSNTTAGQVRNTNRVVDVLTMAANKTASSFADISAAMMYVGPTAAQAHMSIEQVAAAIGALSNRGIEASTAGTTLRQVLAKLTTDTATNRAHMKAIGVDIDQIKKKGVDLPQLIDQINSKLQNKTPTEKMALLNQAFGKLGQGVLALFTKTNSSSKSAGSELRTLESQLEHAGGTTKRIAQQMNNTPQAKWDRFKQTIHAVSITVGSELLPMFTHAMDVVKDLAKRFDELSPGTQKAVTNMLLLVAALKPLSSIVAAPIAGLGTLMNAMKSVMNVGARISGGSLANAFRAVDAAAGSTSGLTNYTNVLKFIGPHTQSAASHTASFGSQLADVGSKAVSTGSSAASLAGNISKFGAGAAEGAAETATLGSALVSTGEAGLVVAAAVAAAVAAFSIYKNAIKPAAEALREHIHESSIWGAQVGKDASEAGEKYMSFSDKASEAMEQAAQGTTNNASTIKSAFKGMADSAESSVSRSNSALKKLGKDLGGSAGNTIDKYRKAQLKNGQSQVKAIRQDARLAQQIIDTSSKNGLHLTADTRTELNNLQADMTAHFVKTLNVSRATSRRMASIINGTFNKHISARVGNGLIDKFESALTKNANATRSKMQELSSAYRNGLIDYKTYATTKAQLETTYGGRSVKLIEGMVRTLHAEGKSWKDAKALAADWAAQYGATGKQIDQALSNIEHSHHRAVKGIVADLTQVKGTTKKAGKAWNDLILNPKTGKVRTNVGKFLANVAKSDSGWKKLKYITKHAKISNNAKDLIVDAAVASGRWNSMSFSQKMVLVHFKGAKDMAHYLEKNHQWNNLNYKVQQAIVKAKGKQELLDVFLNLKNWNMLTPKQKQLVINSYQGANKLQLELQNIKEWNNLSLKKKTAILDAAKTGGMEAALKKAHLWMALPASMRKDVEALDKTGQGIASAKRTVDGFTKTKSTKTVHVNINTGNVVTDINNMSREMDSLSHKNPRIKFGATKDPSLDQTLSFARQLNRMNGKQISSHLHVSGAGEVKAGASAQRDLSGTHNVNRNNLLTAPGTGAVNLATSAQIGLQGTKTQQRNNHLSASGIGQVNGATGAQHGLMSTRTQHRPNQLSASGTGQVNSAAAAQRSLMATAAKHIVNTITTIFRTIGKAVNGHHYWGTAGAWQFKHFAYGTPNTGFEGGPVIVGDGGRKEVVYEPQSRMLFTTPATDSLMDLEKGSTIWRSVEAFEQAMRFAGIKNYPKFGNGNALSSMVDVSAKLPEDFTSELRDVNNQETRQANKAAKETRDLQMQNNELIAMLVQQNQQMMSFLSRVGFNFNVNGKEFAQATAQDNSKAISHYIKQSGMRFT